MRVITIGRSPTNDVVIDNDTQVSRHHLQIVQDDYGNFRLADFGSKNGTYVNGRRVYGEIHLGVNDVVRIGTTTLEWRSYFPPGHGGGYPPPPREPQFPPQYPPYQPPTPMSGPIKIEIDKPKKIVRGDDGTVSFWHNFGERTGTAIGGTLGCLASALIIVIVIVIIGFIISVVV